MVHNQGLEFAAGAAAEAAARVRFHMQPLKLCFPGTMLQTEDNSGLYYNISCKAKLKGKACLLWWSITACMSNYDALIIKEGSQLRLNPNPGLFYRHSLALLPMTDPFHSDSIISQLPYHHFESDLGNSCSYTSKLSTACQTLSFCLQKS